MRRVFIVLSVILCALLLWLGPPLLAVAFRANDLRHDYADADSILRATPAAAVLGIVQVSGTDSRGRYLLRGRYGFPSAFTVGAQGWYSEFQGGNGYVFARGQERLSGICRRFSGGFEVCDLNKQNPLN